MKITRILIPVDFSASALSALDYAVEFAKPFKAELLVLFVVEPIYYTAPDLAGTPVMGDLLEDQRRNGRAQLLRLEQRYAKRRVKLRALLQTGTPYQAITDTAKQMKAGLIIMATHGRTGLTHLLMGSVAERVVRAATCPVLTLRPRVRAPRKAARKRAPAAPRRRR